MSDDALVIAGMGDLVATVPHMLGAQPENSVVVFPVDPGQSRPVARADLPNSPAGQSEMAQAIGQSYARFAGSDVVLVAFTDQLARAASVCEALTRELEPANTVVGQVAAQGDDWVRLDTDESGTISQAARDRIAVEFINHGKRQPYDSLAQMRASFDPTGEDLALKISHASAHTSHALSDGESQAAEERWITHRIQGFVARGRQLPPDDAARLISDVQAIPLRDHAMMEATSTPSLLKCWV